MSGPMVGSLFCNRNTDYDYLRFILGLNVPIQ